MRIVVLDTSALIRFYVPDGELPEGLEKSIESAWRSESILMAPELIFAEAAQVLWKKEKAGFIQAADADEILSSIMELPIERAGHYDLMPGALTLARQHNLTVYDALFLFLASSRGAELITCDSKLARVFKNL